MFNQNCEISLSQCPSQPLAATGCANLVGYGDISAEGGEGRGRERERKAPRMAKRKGKKRGER